MTKDVDEYINQAPKGVQTKLRKLRSFIKKLAPDATEKISYGMPSYHYNGRLFYFGLWKKHIGIYPILEEEKKAFKKELEPYGMSTGTVRFPLDEELPYDLIEKLIQFRIKRNEESEKNKK